MSDETKRVLTRNFAVPGAPRRGLAWVMACFIAAYAPQIQHSFEAVAAALFG